MFSAPAIDTLFEEISESCKNNSCDVFTSELIALSITRRVKLAMGAEAYDSEFLALK